MPVFMLTFHAYRSWNVDRRHVVRGEWGIKPPNEKLARHRDEIAGHDAARFDGEQQIVLRDMAIDACGRRDIRLHGGSVTPTHVHLLVSWREERDVGEICEKLKSVLGWALSKQRGGKGHRWFSRGEDTTPVERREHFDYVLGKYFPKHVKEGGICWREGTS